jgi:hypothetical protein
VTGGLCLVGLLMLAFGEVGFSGSDSARSTRFFPPDYVATVHAHMLYPQATARLRSACITACDRARGALQDCFSCFSGQTNNVQPLGAMVYAASFSNKLQTLKSAQWGGKSEWKHHRERDPRMMRSHVNLRLQCQGRKALKMGLILSII